MPQRVPTQPGVRSAERSAATSALRFAFQRSAVLCTGIRLAGATSDVHIMDVRTGKWKRATPAGEAPSPRAAHAAAAVGSMVVVQVQLGCWHKAL